ncbi:MAG: hypothetical protein JXQ73_01620 [Phycisphaerae bacterium]|nr:hypothetical protein [Phycisphaerae bacterium]
MDESNVGEHQAKDLERIISDMMNISKLDILVGLADVDPIDYGPDARVAHSLQFGLIALGRDEIEAIRKLISLIIVHCKLCLKDKRNPINFAPDIVLYAFLLGTPIEIGEDYIDARMRDALHDVLREGPHGKSSSARPSVEVRDVSAIQERTGSRELESVLT